MIITTEASIYTTITNIIIIINISIIPMITTTIIIIKISTITTNIIINNIIIIIIIIIIITILLGSTRRISYAVSASRQRNRFDTTPTGWLLSLCVALVTICFSRCCICIHGK